MPLLILLLWPHAGRAQYFAQRVATGLSLPVSATSPSSDPRLFIVEQGGRIRIWDGTQILATPFLDLSGSISSGGERGLLGLAFSPGYANDGLFYVHYTDPNGDTTISRIPVSGGNPDLADAGAEEVLFTVAQPFGNHNGGQIAFGPNDGYLYIALGDGGSGNDPQDNAQNLTNPLGKILRIDVSSSPGYGIPGDNPFVGVPGADERIWSYGLRNPYRFSFDRSNGDLWIGDVGQAAVEEVNLQRASSAGGENYGWRCWEGSQPHIQGNCPDPGDVTFPAVEYPHQAGVLSVTGGYRYRGPEVGLDGIYFFADYGGLLFTATEGPPDTFTLQPITISTDVGSIAWVSGFGEDADGDLYVLNHMGGEIHRLVAGGVDPGCPVAPDPDCREDALSIALLRDTQAPGDPDLTGSKARLVFHWVRGGTQGAPVAQAHFGNPVAADDVHLCFYEDGDRVFDMTAPGGSAGWKEIPGKGYKYVDSGATADGILKVLLKGGDAGKARVLVIGKGSAMPLGVTFPLAGPAWEVQARSDGTGLCWGASLGQGDVLTNKDVGVFKARRQGP